VRELVRYQTLGSLRFWGVKHGILLARTAMNPVTLSGLIVVSPLAVVLLAFLADGDETKPVGLVALPLIMGPLFFCALSFLPVP
jgi:hypothetical protein